MIMINYSMVSFVKYWYGNKFPIHDPSNYYGYPNAPWKDSLPQWDPNKPKHRCVADYGLEIGWKSIECSCTTSRKCYMELS